MPENDLAERQRARMADPKTDIDAGMRADAAGAAIRAAARQTKSQFARLKKTPSIAGQIYWLHRMADTFGQAVAPHADARIYYELYANIHIKPGMTRRSDVGIADIRDFFPHG